MAALVYVLLGPPGAGKGTQAEILAQSLNAVHLSSGEILRNSSDKSVVDYIATGMLAKSDDFKRIVENSIRNVPEDRVIVLDSVAKKKGEPEWLVGLLKELNRPLRQVLFINVPRDEAVSRNLKRGRADDSVEAQQVRWQQFTDETRPVLAYYSEKGLLTEVDGVGTVAEVADRIQKALV